MSKHTDSVEATILDFSGKFYYPIQQKQVKYEDIVDWLRTKFTTLQATLQQQVEEEVKDAYEAGRAYEAQQCRGSAADNHPNAPYDLPELYPWKDSFERLTTITPNHQD